MAMKYHMFRGSQRGSALCDECKLAIAELKTVWEQKAIQDEAKELLDDLCDQLGSYKDTCDNLVSSYWPLVVQEVDALLSNPESACSEIGLCASRIFNARGHKLTPSRRGKVTLHAERNSHVLAFIRRLTRIQTREGASTGCSVCVYSVGVMLETLKLDPDLLKSWAEGIQNICTEFPTAMQPGCNDFLSIYLEPVLRVTVNSVSPRKVCTMVKACTSSTYESRFEYQVLRASRPRVGSEIVCESCKLLAEFLKTECANPDFQTEVKNELKQICNFVPGQYADTCEQLIESYIPQLFNLAETELDPNTICPELSLCPQTRVEENSESEETEEQLIRTF
jgi:saposin